MLTRIAPSPRQVSMQTRHLAWRALRGPKPQLAGRAAFLPVQSIAARRFHALQVQRDSGRHRPSAAAALLLSATGRTTRGSHVSLPRILCLGARAAACPSLYVSEHCAAARGTRVVACSHAIPSTTRYSPSRNGYADLQMLDLGADTQSEDPRDMAPASLRASEDARTSTLAPGSRKSALGTKICAPIARGRQVHPREHDEQQVQPALSG